MAIVSDMRAQYQRRIDELLASASTAGGGVVAMDTDGTALEVGRLQGLIADEERKRADYRVENIRRKHNYLPFVVELLRLLAEQGKLVEITERARERGLERKRKEKEKKEAKKSAASGAV